MNTEVSDLDHYDSRILGELQRDARITMAELGRRLRGTATTASTRMMMSMTRTTVGKTLSTERHFTWRAYPTLS